MLTTLEYARLRKTRRQELRAKSTDFLLRQIGDYSLHRSADGWQVRDSGHPRVIADKDTAREALIEAILYREGLGECVQGIGIPTT